MHPTSIQKRLVALLLAACCFCLSACTGTTADAFKTYVDADDGYEFLYPNGWMAVATQGGPDVVLHDLIEQSENISVIISEVAEGSSLDSLGTPTEVGRELARRALAPEGSGRTAELLSATQRQSEEGSKEYYLLEYQIRLPGMVRHDLASVTVRRGKLFTCNLSATQRRWQKMEEIFRQSVGSFSVY